MSKASTQVSFPFASLLTLLFIGLKLTGHIQWSWWWVLSPLWISAGLIFFFIVLVGIIAAFAQR